MCGEGKMVEMRVGWWERTKSSKTFWNKVMDLELVCIAMGSHGSILARNVNYVFFLILFFKSLFGHQWIVDESGQEKSSNDQAG